MIDIQHKVANQDGLYEVVVNGKGDGNLRIISVSKRIFSNPNCPLQCISEHLKCQKGGGGEEREGACSCLPLLRLRVAGDKGGQGGGGVCQERGHPLLHPATPYYTLLPSTTPCCTRAGNGDGTQDLQRCSARGSVFSFSSQHFGDFSPGDY